MPTDPDPALEPQPQPEPDTGPQPEPGTGPGSAPGRSGPRRGLAWTALTLGCAALLVANLAVFLRAFVFDRDTFADAVAPRHPDETVINGLADTLSARIVSEPAVQDRIDDLVPHDNPLVEGVITSSAGDVIDAVLRQVLSSDAFRTVWRAAVERAHDTFVAVIEDDDREPVVLDLTRTLADVDRRLERRGIDLLDDATIDHVGRVVTVRRDQIDEVRTWLDLLQRYTVVIVIAALVLLAGAVALATERRRMLARVGVGIAVAMVVSGSAMRFAKHRLTGRIEVDVRRDAVASLWDRVFASLVHQTVVLLLVGLAIAVVAWLVGPGSRATALRRRVGVGR
jgi:hypothetical protein